MRSLLLPESFTFSLASFAAVIYRLFHDMNDWVVIKKMPKFRLLFLIARLLFVALHSRLVSEFLIY
jgi:hypothetical protein